MWLFKRRTKNHKSESAGPPCVHCGSTNTMVVSPGGGQTDDVKTWRGQRYVTCRCLSCGRDFYSEEAEAGEARTAAMGRMVEDEEALRAAEEELKRQTDEEGDRRYSPGG